MEPQTVNFTLPELSRNTFVTAYAQFRPHRYGGLRTQHEKFEGKDVFHNYGHGGAGWSMSYGTTSLAIESFQQVHKSGEKVACAVIGSGAMGLLTAIQLHKLGHLPTIYTAKIPKPGEKDNTKCITSQVAPGLWLPYGYDNQDEAKHHIVSQRSFEYFSECIKNKKYPKGLHWVTVYDRALAEGVLEEAMPKAYTDNKATKVKVHFQQNGFEEVYTRFETIRLNTEMFVGELLEELNQRGVKIVEKKIESVSQLEEQYVFNCSALGSKELFGDQNCVGIQGHLLEFKNPDPEKHNYFIRTKFTLSEEEAKEMHDLVYVYCQEQRILVGLTREDDRATPEVDSVVVEKMIKAVERFIRERTQQ